MQPRHETGSCFCGAIRADLFGDPFWINYDHDDDCRKALGSPLAIWIGYRAEQVRFTRGSPRLFSRTPGVERSFCGTCGSSIGYSDAGLANEHWLTIGFMDAPERFPPQAHGYVSMKLPWIALADDLPRFDTYTRPRDPAIGAPAARRSK